MIVVTEALSASRLNTCIMPKRRRHVCDHRSLNVVSLCILFHCVNVFPRKDDELCDRLTHN